MAKYHHFQNFVVKKHCSELYRKIPLFMVLEFFKLEFLEVLPPWHCWGGNWEIKKIMWYSSMVNSSTMQHNTRVYQARVPFYNKMLFFFFLLFLQYSISPSSSTLQTFYFILFLGGGDYQQININIKWCLFYFKSTQAHLARVPSNFFFFF